MLEAGPTERTSLLTNRRDHEDGRQSKYTTIATQILGELIFHISWTGFESEAYVRRGVGEDKVGWRCCVVAM